MLCCTLRRVAPELSATKCQTTDICQQLSTDCACALNCTPITHLTPPRGQAALISMRQKLWRRQPTVSFLCIVRPLSYEVCQWRSHELFATVITNCLATSIVWFPFVAYDGLCHCYRLSFKFYIEYTYSQTLKYTLRDISADTSHILIMYVIKSHVPLCLNVTFSI